MSRQYMEIALWIEADAENTLVVGSPEITGVGKGRVDDEVLAVVVVANPEGVFIMDTMRVLTGRRTPSIIW